MYFTLELSDLVFGAFSTRINPVPVPDSEVAQASDCRVGVNDVFAPLSVPEHELPLHDTYRVGEKVAASFIRLKYTPVSPPRSSVPHGTPVLVITKGMPHSPLAGGYALPEHALS